MKYIRKWFSWLEYIKSGYRLVRFKRLVPFVFGRSAVREVAIMPSNAYKSCNFIPSVQFAVLKISVEHAYHLIHLSIICFCQYIQNVL